MALKLLQPGFVPLGQFDMKDGDTIRGGYVVVAEAMTMTDGYAADLKNVSTSQCQFSVGAAADDKVWGLADDGSTAAASSGYGTLFGTAIGGTAGQGTGQGTLTSRGSVVLGPATTLASGKVTVWTQPGLYGISSDSLTETTMGTVAGTVQSNGSGVISVAAGTGVGITLGKANDTSLVSTTNTAAGGTAGTEYYAIYSFGPQSA